MSTPRCPSLASIFCLGLALSVLLAMSSIAQAQKQASCTFTFFQFTRFQPLNQPTGINDWGTVVGGSGSIGFIRYVGGGFIYYKVPNASNTVFSDRNNKGVSIGGYFTSGSRFQKGFVLNKSRSSFTSVVHPKSVSGSLGTAITRINKWNTIVGWYWDAQNVVHGFKRDSNGGFVTLNFPRAAGQGTFFSGLNDNGMIVGGSGMHGVIYYRGQWAMLDFPNASLTTLAGISNAGVIIGNAEQGLTTTAFLYSKGVFKVISVPNVRTTEVTGISPKLGLITGDTRDSNGTPQGFIAKCN